jgi:hypothetical protein
MKTLYVGVDCLHNQISMSITQYRVAEFAVISLPVNLRTKFEKHIRKMFSENNIAEIEIINKDFRQHGVRHDSIKYDIAIRENILKEANKKFTPYINDEIQKYMVNNAEKFI